MWKNIVYSKNQVGDPNPDVTTPNNSGELIIRWPQPIQWPEGYVWPMGLTVTQQPTHSPAINTQQLTSGNKIKSLSPWIKDFLKAADEQGAKYTFDKSGVIKIYSPQGDRITFHNSGHGSRNRNDAMAYRGMIKDLERIGLGDHPLIDKWRATYRTKQQVMKRQEFNSEDNMSSDSNLTEITSSWKSISSFQKHAPYGIPKDKGGDSARNDAKMERCVEKVMKEGHDKASAIAICKESLGFTKSHKKSAWKTVTADEGDSGEGAAVALTDSTQTYPFRESIEKQKKRYEQLIKSREAVSSRSFRRGDLERLDPKEYSFSLLGQFTPDPNHLKNFTTEQGKKVKTVGDLAETSAIGLDEYFKTLMTKLDSVRSESPSAYSEGAGLSEPLSNSVIDELRKGAKGFTAPQGSEPNDDLKAKSKLDWLSAIRTHFTPHEAFKDRKTGHIIEVYKTSIGTPLVIGPDGMMDRIQHNGSAIYRYNADNDSYDSVTDSDLGFTASPIPYVHEFLRQMDAIPDEPAPRSRSERQRKEKKKWLIDEKDLEQSKDLDKLTPKTFAEEWRKWRHNTSSKKKISNKIVLDLIQSTSHSSTNFETIPTYKLSWKSIVSSWKSITSHWDPDDDDDDDLNDNWDEDEDEWLDDDWGDPQNPTIPSNPTVVNPSGYNEKDDPLIAFVNASTLLSDQEVELIQKACQKQVDDDFGPSWHLGMRSIFVAKGDVAPLNAWQIMFLDKPTISGALGYHDFQNGQPIAYIFISTSQQANVSPSSVASHEILEMLGDPLINTTAQVGSQTFYALEACDAVQQSSYTVNVELNGLSYPVEVSNFVTPDWFRTQTNGPWDFLRKLSGPLELLPNGSYIGVWTPRTGWIQKNAYGDSKPISDEDKRYVGEDEKSTVVYHAPQEPQRCLRPFQRRQMDKPIQITSNWRMISTDNKSPRKLWLDDIRPAPEGWDHFKTAAEAIKALSQGSYNQISLDHDLGPEEAGTGYDVVKWLEEQYFTNPDFQMPSWKVHSANPVGRDKMENVLKRLNKSANKYSWKSVTAEESTSEQMSLFPTTESVEEVPTKTKKPKEEKPPRKKLERTDYYFLKDYKAPNNGSCSSHPSECHKGGVVAVGDPMIRAMGITGTVVQGDVKFLHADGPCKDTNLAELDRQARQIELRRRRDQQR